MKGLRRVVAVLLLAASLGPLAAVVASSPAGALDTVMIYDVSCTVNRLYVQPPLAGDWHFTQAVGYDAQCSYSGTPSLVEAEVDQGGFYEMVTIYDLPDCAGLCTFDYLPTTPGLGSDSQPCGPGGVATCYMPWIGDDSGTPYAYPGPFGSLSSSSGEAAGNSYCNNDGGGTDWICGNAFSGAEEGTTGPCDLRSQPAAIGGEADGHKAYGYSYSFDGGATEVVLDTGDGSTSQTIHGKAFAGDSDVQPHPSSPVVLSIRPPAGTSLAGIHAWCYYSGTWYDWGTPTGDGTSCTAEVCVNPVPTSPGTGAFDLGSCFASAGWSLWDPFSWVSGGLHDGLCILEWLFIPPHLDGGSYGITSLVQGKLPFVWLADAFDAVGTLHAGVTTALASGVCDGPSVSPFAGGSLDAHHVGSGAGLAAIDSFSIHFPAPADLGCSGPGDATAGELFGWRVAFRTLLEFMLFFAAIAVGWAMMPWSFKGDSVDNSIGRVSDAIRGVGEFDSGEPE